MLALARNIPQAHAALVDGRWERSKFGGVEVVREDARASSASAASASSSPTARTRLRHEASSPTTRSCRAERFRELGVEQAESSDELYARRRLHHDPPAEDARDRGLARRRGVRQDARTACAIINCARGELRRRRGAQGRARLRQGRRRGARRVHARSRSPTTRCSATPTSSSRRTSAPRPPRRRTAPACRPPSRSSPR